MKKLSTLALAIALLGYTKSQAQTHDVSLNFAPIAFGNFSGNYSYNFAEDMSFGSVIGYQNLQLDDGTNSYTYSGFYIAPEFRFYFNPNEGNDAFFAGGYLKYRNVGTSGEPFAGTLEDFTAVTYDQRNNGLAFGVITGKLWQSRKGFNFTIWTGLGYYLIDNTTYTNNYDPDKDPVVTTVSNNLPSLDFRFGLNVGYRFGM